VVDILDFPLDPPDASGIARGGQDFGIYRERYNGIHTGEDWWFGSGRSSFGTPVHSIGHGVVTYAAPLGWGADQGVLIVRHTFPDGSTILSFYGHLDPPSVVLRAGECVERGEQVGRIGRPRSSPHLHFEIRAHMPSEPGPGYWWTDPTTAGWEPPSQFIWDNRIANAPGGVWSQSSSTSLVTLLVQEDTLVAADDERMMGLNLTDGSLSWSLPLTRTMIAGVKDSDQEIFYALNSRRELKAYAWPDPAAPPELLWEEPVGSAIAPLLMPLPGGGVAVSLMRETIAFSARSTLLWEIPIGRAVDWATAGDRLLFSTTGRDGTVWAADQSEATRLDTGVTGQLAVVEDQIIIYAQDGIYRFDPATEQTRLLYPLLTGLARFGDIVTSPDGTILVSHTDIRDRRLIAMDANGELLWERSFAGLIQSQQTLLAADGQVYLFVVASSSTATSDSVIPAYGQVALLTLDMESAELVHIFTGGTRAPRPELTLVEAAGQHRLLVNISGSNLVLLDALVAQQAALSD